MQERIFFVKTWDVTVDGQCAARAVTINEQGTQVNAAAMVLGRLLFCRCELLQQGKTYSAIWQDRGAATLRASQNCLMIMPAQKSRGLSGGWGIILTKFIYPGADPVFARSDSRLQPLP